VPSFLNLSVVRYIMQRLVLFRESAGQVCAAFQYLKWRE
jgi:hypothetical protein